jgi:hypothetical protein
MDWFKELSKPHPTAEEREAAKAARMRVLASIKSKSEGITKVAFDTRRVAKDAINPRRGVAEYNRSEQFISEAMSNKITLLVKLFKVLEGIREDYKEHPGWVDSYARILYNLIEGTLRIKYKDGEYSDTQKSVHNLDYISDMLFNRYRLDYDRIERADDAELRKAVLAKDEELREMDPIKRSADITKSDISTHSYQDLLAKLFSVKATAENPDVERTITITVRDKINGS